MAPKRLPIKIAHDIARTYAQRQVIVVTWDGALTHVVTYGKSVEDCAGAAIGGNKVKFALGWPESLCRAEPSRVKRLREENKKLRDRLSSGNLTMVEAIERGMKDGA